MVDRYRVSPPDRGVLSGRNVVVPMPLLETISTRLVSLRGRDLHLVAHVTVPFYTCDIVFNLVVYCTCTVFDAVQQGGCYWGIVNDSRKVPVHGEKLRVILDLTTHLVDMKVAKVLSVLSLPIGSNVGEVLVPEENDTPLGGEKRDFI